MNKFEKTIEQLQRLFPSLKEILVVFVYGSVARGDYSLRHSDLDLFIILKARKLSSRTRERLDKAILLVGYKEGVRIHLEYQRLTITAEDRTLVRKMIEEGKIIYSAGTFTFDYHLIGLQQYLIYEFTLKKSPNPTMFSKVLHGRKSWYWKGEEKVIKIYPGIIDNKDIMELGRSALMVRKNREKEMRTIFENFGVEYKLKKIVYG